MTSNPLIRKLGYGAELSEADQQHIKDVLCTVREFDAHDDVISEGDRPENVRVVLEGFACRYKLVPDGGRQIMAYLVPGDFCDLHVALLGEMDHSISTITKCKVAEISQKAVHEITVGWPAITRALWWATLVDEGVLREWLVSMGRRPADKQLAHLICELAYRLHAVGLLEGRSFPFPFTQNDLGDTLGISEVHANRMLQQLRHDRLIELPAAGRRITVPDRERLEDFADFDPAYLHLKMRSN